MATKVILTQDVEHLGVAGTVQTVKEGFARNYLLPKRLAEIATTGTIKQVQERQAAVERRIHKQEEELRSLGDKIAATTLTFTARVGENGRLFGSITAQEIADALSRAVGEVTVAVVGEGGETAEETAPAADAQPDQPEPPEA